MATNYGTTLNEHDPFYCGEQMHPDPKDPFFVGEELNIGTTNAIHKPRKTSPIFTLSILLLAILIIILGVVYNSSSTTESTEIVASDSSPVKSQSMTFTLMRFGYPVIPEFSSTPSSYLKYAFLNDYCGVIEPNVPMQLLMKTASDTSQYNYDFTICKSGSSDSNDCFSGTQLHDEDSPTLTISCSPFDVYDITVNEQEITTITATDMDGSSVTTSSTSTRQSETAKLMCMYVRREIQDLSTDDLNIVLDTMHTLWEYDDEAGQALYGNNFHSASYFADAHFFNAAWQHSDHIHEGMGFLPQHVKLSNMFELAMQSVNPAVSLPYWEFTQDVIANITVFDSFMFTADTFGSLETPADVKMGFTYSDYSVSSVGRIPDGRWANLKASENTKYTKLLNGYGYMRAPWVANPSPYVTRYAAATPTLPQCKSYYSTFNMGDIVDFLDDTQKDPHASVHAVVGNVFGCDLLEELLQKGLINDVHSQIGLCKQWSYYMKDLYRSNYIAPTVNCTVPDVDSVSLDDLTCGYKCNPDQYDDMSSKIQELVRSDYVPSDLTDEDWDVYRDFVCTGNAHKILVGAHMEAASASDPSFWPVHPTQERMLHARLMASLVTEIEWPTDSTTDSVCDLYYCYEESYGTKDYYGICCYGHFENDQMLDFVTGDETSYIGQTNYETMQALNPVLATYSMPYIYDEFDWSHCPDGIAETLTNIYEAAVGHSG